MMSSAIPSREIRLREFLYTRFPVSAQERMHREIRSSHGEKKRRLPIGFPHPWKTEDSLRSEGMITRKTRSPITVRAEMTQLTRQRLATTAIRLLSGSRSIPIVSLEEMESRPTTRPSPDSIRPILPRMHLFRQSGRIAMPIQSRRIISFCIPSRW